MRNESEKQNNIFIIGQKNYGVYNFITRKIEQMSCQCT
nr:MAG TPA: hypothetical protein [Caudoviricetes sp.]DAP74100.1 MAG TPA: hypothetical protein [Caudoviricetes sp.]DAT04118.1 MAG TPA: hypothetical protein [Caudoviricetes sp.]DAV04191.1 MAG TPA: hypothetical protein [Caudoviricetes sp.]